MAYLRQALAAATFLAVAVVPAAAAMTPQEEATFRDNCTADYMRFCAMHAPESPQVEQCFKTKMRDLTPECRTVITAFSKKNPGGRR